MSHPDPTKEYDDTNGKEPELDEFLVAAKDNFEQACAEENWEQAKAVIADLRNGGYLWSARTLESELVRLQEGEV